MNTIQLNARGHEMVFTTRSLTIDGREYLYKDMSSIKHSAENRIYIFRYDGEWQKLFYEEQDARIVNTLFLRIAGMNKANKAKAEAAAAAEGKQTQQKPETEVSAEEAPAETEPAETPAEDVPVAEAPTDEPEPETPESDSTDTPVTEADLFYTIHPGSENKPVITDTILREDALRKSEIEAKLAEAEALETAETETDVEAEAAEASETSDKNELPEVEFSDTHDEEGSRETTSKFKLKKALIILAIVLAFFVLLGVVRYALFGLAGSPNYGPKTDQTNQYNDIDELINDLQ